MPYPSPSLLRLKQDEIIAAYQADQPSSTERWSDLEIAVELIAGALGVSVDEDGNIIGASTSVPQGPLYAVTVSTLGNRPSSTSGIRFEIPDAATITYGIAGTANTVTRGPYDGGDTFDEPLALGDEITVTAVTGSVLYRWVKI